MKRAEKEKKRQDKRERIKKGKTELRQKMSVIASSDLHNENEDILIDRKTFEKLQEMDIEEMEYQDNEENEEEEELPRD